MLTPLSIMFLVVVLDQLTKWRVITTFMLYESHEVLPGFFNLTYLRNTGAAFGFLAGDHGMWRQVLFVGIAVVALIFMFTAFFHFRKQGMLFVYGLGLIGGGAVGNLLDRLRFGSVIDFFDFYIKGHHWPAFNVADSAICVGVGMFLLGSFIHSDKE
ncbi:MAG: signal peptidase II [Desulfobulbaceae bacterium]|nr:signal peptidase II [Desulfobulbaceae bacterium]